MTQRYGIDTSVLVRCLTGLPAHGGIAGGEKTVILC